jgi:nucleoside phosphorylase
MTALPVEFQAVREHMVDVTERIHPAGTMFYIGRLPGARRRVALVEVGPGNRDAAVVTERAISFLQPEFPLELLVFVGIAGGLQSDIALGDVVVPPHIHAYHGGMEDNDGFHARPRGWDVSHHLLQRAKDVARCDTWWKCLSDVSQSVGVHFRPIAAGDVVVNSRESRTARLIRRHYNDAAAVEMESAGFANASQLNESLPFIVVRGISDSANGDKYTTDRAGGQPPAARHAAAFAVALLTELPPVNTGHRAPSAQVVVPVNVAPATVETWEGGADVRIGDHQYLLVDDDHLLERTAADGAVVRQARGLRITSKPAHAWLRQVRARSSTAELEALVAEQALRVDLPAVRGLPTLVQSHRDERVVSLVYGWPTSRSTGSPCDTLATLGGGRVSLDRLRVRRLLTGMAGLCTALAALHDRGLAHRRLTLAGIIEHDDGTLVLRDLGLTARKYESGEAPRDYGAPEQSRRSLHRPGPGTDVFQLAMVTCHLVTGQLPNPVNPLPLNHFRPDLPDRLGAAVDAALHVEPADRPDVRALGQEFRAASRELG